MTKKSQSAELSPEQLVALNHLLSGENIFLTGGAGSGKSYVIREFMKQVDVKSMPILASTGAAAVLLGGRTFHSFFGLGIMDGGPNATFERCLKDGKLAKRLKGVEGIIIDEISMIPGSALMIAETLAQTFRQNQLPWGGLRVVVVGDFAQLPPVTRTSQRDWCFQNTVWEKSGFASIVLKSNQRVQDSHYIDVLQSIRFGKVTATVTDFLNTSLKDHDEDQPGTRLFPRRDQSEQYNLKKLMEINDDEFISETIFIGQDKAVESLKKSCPAPVTLKIKIGCQVLFLQNDPQKRWINGTKGIVTGIEVDKIKVRKISAQIASQSAGRNHSESEMDSIGREVTVEKSSFALQDADGNILAQGIQFPLALGYATTIHKSQGATLDEIWCDLSSLWEPGQAYVALSRLRTSQGLHLLRWQPRSIIVDPGVVRFYQDLELGSTLS